MGRLRGGRRRCRAGPGSAPGMAVPWANASVPAAALPSGVRARMPDRKLILRGYMDTQEQIAVIVHTISHQGGRIDALNAVMASMLHLAKSSPGLREAIEAQLEQNYSSLLARSENPQYVAGFESVREIGRASCRERVCQEVKI